jgi:hypothetical protein
MSSVMRFDEWQDSNGVPVASGVGGNLAPANGYLFKETVYFTSSGTFTKATYPWLRAIRVKCQAAGGGGGGTPATALARYATGQGGTGGAYVESFITDIAGLASSVTVTRGSGGAGAAAGANNGSNGGSSSFGSLVIASGGLFGAAGISREAGIWTPGKSFSGSVGTGNIGFFGGGSSAGVSTEPGTVNGIISSVGGGSFLAPQMSQVSTGGASGGRAGIDYGHGGEGGFALNQQVAQTGGAGANGIVIVELYS